MLLDKVKVAFIVNCYTKLVLNEGIARNITIKFFDRSTDLLWEEVQAHLYLKFRW